MAIAASASARPHKPPPRPAPIRAQKAHHAVHDPKTSKRKPTKTLVSTTKQHANPSKSAMIEPIAKNRPAPPRPEQGKQIDSQIHITHNRKHHLVDGDLASSVPRQAMPADFLAVQSPAQTVAASRVEDDDQHALATPNHGVGVEADVPVRVKLTAAAALKREIAKEVIAPLVALYNKRGHLIMPPALKGSHEILLRQNEIADRDGLVRVQDDEDIERMRAAKSLVALPVVDGLQTDERLPANRRFCRPWTAQFLTALGRAHYAKFHTSLQVNSAVRTVEFQTKLLRINGNAAPAAGETASPHLTGQAVDLAKHGLSLTEIAWLRGYLLPLVQAGKVDVEEEFQQSCFHISVYKKYSPVVNSHKRAVIAHGGAATTLAAVMH